MNKEMVNELLEQKRLEITPVLEKRDKLSSELLELNIKIQEQKKLINALYELSELL